MNIKEESVRVKHLEIIGDNLSKSGWSCGCIINMDSERLDIFLINAHRDVGVGNIAELGENIVIRGFVRHLVGEPLPSEC